jgi:hypothetical protein
MPVGYRDWKLISGAYEEANLNSFGAVLGNDIAIKASRRNAPIPGLGDHRGDHRRSLHCENRRIVPDEPAH